jgi:peptide/nickel transport system permease protein
MIPVITVVGLQIGNLLGGAVVTETVFAWPGIGSLAVVSIYQRDYPVVQAVVLLSAAVFVIINFLLDVIYQWLDPRISYAGHVH